MKSIPFIKMHGCRNDYIYVDRLAHPEIPELDWPAISRRVSDRKTGIGSDGLILVEKATQTGLQGRMRMFNADGSEGKMCGNGIRCVAKLLYEKDRLAQYVIETASGPRTCEILRVESPERAIVRVNMGRPSFLPAKIPVLFDDVMVMDEEFEVDGQMLRVSCVSMGNPHCVIPVETLETFPVDRIGPMIEKHEVFPEGVNVEFIEFKGGEVFQRTWERGSGETLACGTGASAVGVVLIMSRKMQSPVTIHLKGGDLKVEWDGLKEVYLTGEAVTERNGEFSVED